MSLDVYLIKPGSGDAVPRHSGIWIRDEGRTIEISRQEWDRRFPGREPMHFTAPSSDDDPEVYHGNITHNLTAMAKQTGLYVVLWRPEEAGIKKAAELIPILREGLANLTANPTIFLPLTPSNGWGSYEGFCAFVAEYLAACERYPDAMIKVWR